MQIKNYQQKAIDQLRLWFDELKKTRLQSEKTAKVLKKQSLKFPKEIKNYPLLAWNSLKEKKLVPLILERGEKKIPEYISRTGADGEPVPHVCLKVPTGGGKTLLGVTAFECMKQDKGFVLWIVPTKAIYEQTLKAFRTREHSYRQILENVSSGKIKLLQKNDRFTKQDIENYLCLMMLMLPSANRQKNKDFLKIFRDSSGYKSFFPEEDDRTANQELLKKHPDLEKNNNSWVKHSLINVLKLIHPTVILDEAHKAYGTNSENNKEFVKSVNYLNPRFVLELSATPKLGISNILMNISGTELKAEEMIKLPIEIHSFINSNWKYTLAETQKKLNELKKEAEKLHIKENRYIRPMAVIRVEQTGKAQIGKGRIHAEDAKEYLIKHLSIPKNQIKIQSSEEKGLASENLMSETSEVRWVITKDALKEGWDCSFAYILALLDNTKANTAITQMVGRVMRQPQAHKVMESDSLNRCYIYCFNKDVGEAVQKVKESLEREGLKGIGSFVHGYDSKDGETERITVKRRKKYKRKIFLPQVLHKKGKRWRPIDYDSDILGGLNWKEIDGGYPVNLDDKNIIQEVKATLDLQGEGKITTETLDINENLTIDFFVRRLSDTVPNPWQATRIANDFLQKHKIKGHNSVKLLNNRIYLSEVLKKRVKNNIDIKAESVFRDKVGKDEIRFRLETDEQLNYEMEHSFSVFVSKTERRTLQGNHGKEIQYSLFEPVFESEFDTQIEKDAAIYLDESNAIYWWHRIAARQAYSLQGWKRHKVYPDFLAYRKDDNRLLIIELKGEQLRENADTKYKENLFKKLEETYKSAYDRGEMKINSPSAVLRMMFEDTWRSDLGLLVKEE